MDPTEIHDPFLDRLAARFHAAGRRLYLVGGVVRDALAGWEIGEIDLTTDAPVEDIKRLASQARPESLYAIGEKFGTISMLAADRRYEITTFRAADLYTDLGHRDFTVNAMAVDLATHELHDPFGGRADLAAGLIRAVGDPAARFAEDPLRLLRAVRLARRFGFRLDPATRTAIAEGTPLLDAVAWERKAAEMNQIMVSHEPSVGIRMLDDTGLLAQLLPEMQEMHDMSRGTHRYKDVYEHTLLVLDRTAPDLTLRWAALLHDVAKPRTFNVQDGEVHFFGHEVIGARMAREALTRLRQPQEMVAEVEQLISQHLRIGLYDETWTGGAVRRFLRETAPVTERLFALARSDVTSANPRRVAAAAARVDALIARCAEIEAQEEVAKIKSPLDGNDLMSLFDRPPGPWIRPLKDYLLDLVLDGQLAQGDVEKATALAMAWIAEHPDGS